MNYFPLSEVDRSWFDEKTIKEREELLYEETVGMNPGQLLVDMAENENEDFVRVIKLIHKSWKSMVMGQELRLSELYKILYAYNDALTHNFAPIISEKIKNGEY